MGSVLRGVAPRRRDDRHVRVAAGLHHRPRGGRRVFDFSNSPCYISFVYLMEAAVETAKVFWSGRSQAVRLPKQFRVEGREVRIRTRGNSIVLEPVPDTWKWLDAITGPLD